MMLRFDVLCHRLLLPLSRKEGSRVGIAQNSLYHYPTVNLPSDIS